MRVMTSLVTASLLLTASVASAQYNAQVLSPPVAVNTTRAYALGGAGHVFGAMFITSVDRRPVLWTDGIGAELPVPAGYYWEDNQRLNFVNDSGTVVSYVRIHNGTTAVS